MSLQRAIDLSYRHVLSTCMYVREACPNAESEIETETYYRDCLFGTAEAALGNFVWFVFKSCFSLVRGSSMHFIKVVAKTNITLIAAAVHSTNVR